jgi:hypothetical protein
MCEKLTDHAEHSHHALLNLLELRVCPLSDSVNEADIPLLRCGTLSGSHPLYSSELGLVCSPGLLLLLSDPLYREPILSLLTDKLLKKRGELGRLSHLGLRDSSNSW